MEAGIRKIVHTLKSSQCVFCVYVCVCLEHMYVIAWVCMCVHVEARGQLLQAFCECKYIYECMYHIYTHICMCKTHTHIYIFTTYVSDQPLSSQLKPPAAETSCGSVSSTVVCGTRCSRVLPGSVACDFFFLFLVFNKLE